ncbi:twin-arginine translocation signal domain-containing protein [Acidobacteriota bacterium]
MDNAGNGINGPCKRCFGGVSRRDFLKRCGSLMSAAGAGLVLAGSQSLTSCANRPGKKVKVGLVSVCAPQDWNLWPYVNFDYETRKREIQEALNSGCPEIEFVPLTVEVEPDEEIPRVKELAAQVDGFLVFMLCTNWGLTNVLLPAIAEMKKPAVFVDELYAGSGVFLCHGAKVLRQGEKVVLMSTSRFQDVVDVSGCFSHLGKKDSSLDSFLAEAERKRLSRFAASGDMSCLDDPIKPVDISNIIRRLENTKILRVVSEKSDPYTALGATVEPVSFDEINSAYKKIDLEDAKIWADRWIREAQEVVEPTQEDIQSSAAIYLAMQNLVSERGAQAITMDCLGGFYSGKLPGYPCLGYRQMNDDGQISGTCEAQIPDILAMLISKYMFDRASFASDPVLDTATNQIIYAHCVAPTKMLGTAGPTNPFKIRSHAEDGKGAAIQSLLPLGYMTTSFRMDGGYKSMVIHQAKAVANIDEPKACRTKLAAEVKGDIGRLFYEWDRFSWHRLTVYGDVQEPLENLAEALKMEIIRET